MNYTKAELIAQANTFVAGMQELKNHCTTHMDTKYGSTLHIYQLDDSDIEGMRNNPEQYQLLSRFMYGMNVQGVGAFISAPMVENITKFAKENSLEPNIVLDFITNHEAGHSEYASKKGFHSFLNMLLAGYNTASIEEEIYCDKFAWNRLGSDLSIETKVKIWMTIIKSIAYTLYDLEMMVNGKAEINPMINFMKLIHAEEFMARFEGSTGHKY